MCKSMKSFFVIGVMSGTSLDGVDISYCELWKSNHKWHYKIILAQTISYEKTWKNRLQQLIYQDAMTYVQTDVEYGHLLGKVIHNFVHKNNLDVDFISSHGHTIFHQPQKGFTSQIGQGACIYAETSIPVISDFRTVDVAFGGQGAPFVPIGDSLLFNEYDFCLNLGGIANISFEKDGKQHAFDTCPMNMPLNLLIEHLNLEYDDKGNLARKGDYVQSLFDELNNLDFYKNRGPKSLGKEWVDAIFMQLVNSFSISLEDKLCTICHHIAYQLNETIKSSGITKESQLLITGGGAYHSFFIEVLENYLPTSVKIVLPNSLLINYKEALIFAFLGILRIQNENNVLSEVTGASQNSVNGAIYGNFTYLADKLKISGL